MEEVIVTKGLAQKRMTIMGRGHTGFGYTRSSHVNIRLKKVDFEAMAAQAKSPWEAAQWRKWKRIADNQRQAQEAQQTGVVSAAANA